MKVGKLTLLRGVAMPEKPDIVYDFFQNKKVFWKSATQGYPSTIAVPESGVKMEFNLKTRTWNRFIHIIRKEGRFSSKESSLFSLISIHQS